VPSGALVAAQKAFGAAMQVFQMPRSFLQLPKQVLHTIFDRENVFLVFDSVAPAVLERNEISKNEYDLQTLL
jgi:hypothetical protein